MTASVLTFVPAVATGRQANHARRICHRFHLLACQLYNSAPASGIGRVIAVRRAHLALRTAFDALEALEDFDGDQEGKMLLEHSRSVLYPIHQKIIRECNRNPQRTPQLVTVSMPGSPANTNTRTRRTKKEG